MIHDRARSWRQRPRGYWNLAETSLVAAFVLVMGLIVAFLLKGSLDTHCPGGRIDTDAQSTARMALERMKDELGQSLRVPHAHPLGSPVVRPSLAASGSHNDLMFFVPAVDGDAFKPKDYASYRLVRYYVPADEPNRLRRAVYAVTADTFAGKPLLHAADEGDPEGATTFPALYSPMATPSIAATQGRHWFVNTGSIPTASPIDTLRDITPPYEEDIVTLTGKSDIIAFTVTHAAVARPAKDRSRAGFDPREFEIEVQVIRYLSLDGQVPARTKGAVRLLKETVRIPDSPW